MLSLKGSWHVLLYYFHSYTGDPFFGQCHSHSQGIRTGGHFPSGSSYQGQRAGAHHPHPRGGPDGEGQPAVGGHGRTSSRCDYPRFYATSQMAQTTLRSVCGQGELDELLSEREKINRQLQEILDEHTDPWGIKVSTVEVKHIDLPQDMQRAMARQAEAERERRAMVINAEGEHQAANRLAEAARIISDHPIALQLRYLQTVQEAAAQSKSTTLFPIPIDLFKPFLQLEEIMEKVKKESPDT